MKWINSSRLQYSKQLLQRSQLADDPWRQFGDWYEVAEVEEIEPCAFCLSTCSLEGVPSARMLLMKSYGEEGLFFFTNYDSKKASDLNQNPRASAVFYWPNLERQVTIEGNVEMIDSELSDEYFRTRGYESQIAASISRQGKPLPSREKLLESFALAVERSQTIDLKRPPWWGGYRLLPTRFEYWQGREHRLHDRFEYKQTPSGWMIERLFP